MQGDESKSTPYGWSPSPRTNTVTAVVSGLLGIILLVYGWQHQSEDDWFMRNPFAVNLASSLVFVLLGAPVLGFLWKRHTARRATQQRSKAGDLHAQQVHDLERRIDTHYESLKAPADETWLRQARELKREASRLGSPDRFESHWSDFERMAIDDRMKREPTVGHPGRRKWLEQGSGFLDDDQELELQLFRDRDP